MIYKEFLANDCGLERRLGVIGETHVYNWKDYVLASDIVPKYDIVAHEQLNVKGILFNLLGIALAPSIITYMAATDRWADNTFNIAKHYKKEICELKDSQQTFTVGQLMAGIALSLISIPTLPILYLQLKKYGDPSIPGTTSYKRRIANEKNGKKGIIAKLGDYIYLSNIKERDRIIAEESANIFQQAKGNLLVVCGMEHLDGVVKNLHKRLNLSETMTADSQTYKIDF